MTRQLVKNANHNFPEPEVTSSNLGWILSNKENQQILTFDKLEPFFPVTLNI